MVFNKNLYLQIALITLISTSILLPNFLINNQAINYYNQINWGNQCSNSTFQSPINLLNTTNSLTIEKDLQILLMNYPILKNVKQEVKNNNTLTFAYSNVADAFIVINKFDEEYKFSLTDVVIHCPSEHQFAGKKFDCELQLIHKRSINSADDDITFNYLIISLMLQESGVADNSLFGGADMDFSPYLARKQAYYFYQGSSTIPPCNVDVNWLINTTPITISKTQIDQFKSWISTVYSEVGNNRNIQNQGNRKVYYVIGSAKEIVLGFLMAIVCLLFF